MHNLLQQIEGEKTPDEIKDPHYQVKSTQKLIGHERNVAIILFMLVLNQWEIIILG